MTGTENVMVRVFSAIIESCCKVVIVPLCEDNISRLERRLESEKKRVPRSPDLSTDEAFAWMKRLGNLKNRSENLLASSKNQDGFCSAISAFFKNFIAANLLDKWEKLDEEEPAGPTTLETTGGQLTRKSTAPIGSIETDLSLYQPVDNVVRGRDEGNRNYGGNNLWVLDSLGFRGEGDRATRDLLNKLRKTAGNDATAVVNSYHDTRRLVRAKSFDFEIVHEERSVVLGRWPL